MKWVLRANQPVSPAISEDADRAHYECVVLGEAPRPATLYFPLDGLADLGELGLYHVDVVAEELDHRVGGVQGQQLVDP